MWAVIGDWGLPYHFPRVFCYTMFDLHGHPPRFLKLAFRVEIRLPGWWWAYGEVDSMPISYRVFCEKKDTLPETNSSHLKMVGWKTSFLLGCPISSAMLALGSVHPWSLTWFTWKSAPGSLEIPIENHHFWGSMLNFGGGYEKQTKIWNNNGNPGIRHLQDFDNISPDISGT